MSRAKICFSASYPEGISAQLVRKLAWGHIVILIEQVKDPVAWD